VTATEAPRRLVLVAGSPSHPAGLHEFRAGALLLARCLEAVPGLVVEVRDHGEIPDLRADDVDAVVIYSDGGPSHPILHDRAAERLDGLASAGVGIGMMHYAVEARQGEHDDDLLAWIGGVYLEGVSCNPIWEAHIAELPDHPIARGVSPFTLADEWYFGMQFTQDPEITIEPILVATPSDDVRGGPYVWPHGPYVHVVAASGQPETLMWATQRPDGGRGFGLNGGHVHTNWADDDFRRVVLNALVWVTGADVPAGGVDSTVSDALLSANLDPKTIP